MDNEQEKPVCSETGCCHGITRRQFVWQNSIALTALGLANPRAAMAGPFEQQGARQHFVPADKRLSSQWVETLFSKGIATWYEGDDLKTIGMPIGGVCAGQVYLTGDGRLVFCDLFNQDANSGYGSVNYKVGRSPAEMVFQPNAFRDATALDQGFAVDVKWNDRHETRLLDRRGFPQVRFCGEYPKAQVRYAEAGFPLEISLDAFSPFIPLNAEDSALPATLFSYTLKNISATTVDVKLAGWLQNRILGNGEGDFEGVAVRTNRIVRAQGAVVLDCGIASKQSDFPPPREPVVLADFEGQGYGDWKIEGEAFGTGPARGTLTRQQRVSGFLGKGLVNSFLGGSDSKQGKLISGRFRIDRPYLSFLIGGGGHEGKTCIHLVVDGKIVRSATGVNNERLQPRNWNVREWMGREAHLEIVDAESGPWGHINVDQIELRDTPRSGRPGDLQWQPDFGTMSLAVLETERVFCGTDVAGPPVQLDDVFALERTARTDGIERALNRSLSGALGVGLHLAPGQETTVTFVLSWCLPNLYRGERRVGRFYGTRFKTAAEVARYVAANLERLAAQTRLWHATYYDSTLPHWLLDRLHSTVGNLATTTCQWWEDGRFWAWEGCGCCHGTCGHVWNYEHALARLFPALERSVREKQDFAPGVGFIAETGEIRFRGEGWGLWAGDSQGGYILKAYREHQTSADHGFLQRNWPNIKRAVEFLIEQDANGDGLIEGKQHQTYDQDFYGANTMVGSLYLGALRAAEEMAKEMADTAFAAKCRAIFDAGQKNACQRLFNGEYYIQDVDLRKHPNWQYADGCLADQMFGQGWAHQVNLGYLYPRDSVLKSLASIWKYCWAPDVRPQNEKHAPERWFAYPGEAGLFTCTWPKSEHLGPKSTRYRDEVWTGIEYQVAGHMAFEGMLTEALAICRAVHERYHPGKHNPFNEIECGDHYARALASWGVLLGLAGFEYHGPKKHLGFAPRITPADFRCAFTAAEGWGTLSQRREPSRQVNGVEVKWGKVAFATLAVVLPEGQVARQVRVDGQGSGVEFEQENDRILIRWPGPRTVSAGERLQIEILS